MLSIGFVKAIKIICVVFLVIITLAGVYYAQSNRHIKYDKAVGIGMCLLAILTIFALYL